MNTIIRLTMLEMLKKKILYLTLLLTVGFLILYGIALHYTYDEPWLQTESIIRMTVFSQLISMGIYVTGFITAFLSVFASIGAISSEIEQGNYDAILSKPIARYEIILGRFFGILLVLLPYVTFLYLSVIGLNMFFGKGIMVNLATISIIKSLATLYLLPILLVSIGIFFSTSFSTMGAGVIVVILYFCGMVGGIMEQIGHFIVGNAKTVLTNIGIFTSLIIPSDIIYRKASALLFTTSSGLNMSMDSMMGAAIQPSSLMMGYIGVYIFCMIMLALKKFSSRDL